VKRRDLSEARPRLTTTLGWFTALNVLRSGSGLILLPIYLRYLPPEQYGMLAVLTAVASLFGLMTDAIIKPAIREGRVLVSFIVPTFRAFYDPAFDE
jgi:hypothetical protein